MNSNQFPFSAIVAQEHLKLALTLCAIDPKIGGVLLSGARGTAKSTVARGLADLLPGDSAFVTLPLGATEERITGTLNIEKVLEDGSVEFSPGLLQLAHGGVLYVDEVNLLADHLVDLLLDAAASGRNKVERDGLSHEHAAAFVLVGTMNPEEGELRPQLLDRFGLCVEVNDNYSVEERVAIARARLQFDADPVAFVSDCLWQQQALEAQLAGARQRLTAVHMPEALEESIAARCQSERVEGVRADILIQRASRAYAALHARDCVQADDIEAVAEFALAHRRQAQSNSAPPQAMPPKASPPQSDGSLDEGDWGALPPVSIETAASRQVAVNDVAEPALSKKKVR
ncbi:MAG: AAA family ATPase [Pseudomonadota bacterium]